MFLGHTGIISTDDGVGLNLAQHFLLLFGENCPWTFALFLDGVELDPEAKVLMMFFSDNDAMNKLPQNNPHTDSYNTISLFDLFQIFLFIVQIRPFTAAQLTLVTSSNAP